MSGTSMDCSPETVYILNICLASTRVDRGRCWCSLAYKTVVASGELMVLRYFVEGFVLLNVGGS